MSHSPRQGMEVNLRLKAMTGYTGGEFVESCKYAWSDSLLTGGTILTLESLGGPLSAPPPPAF